jgi:hypothetical protein
MINSVRASINEAHHYCMAFACFLFKQRAQFMNQAPFTVLRFLVKENPSLGVTESFTF